MKKKMSIRKEVRVVVALAGMFLLIAFTERQQGAVVCKNIVVELNNEQENHFLDEADIVKMVSEARTDLLGSNVERVDLKAVETQLKTEKHVADAQLFADLKGNVVVRVALRRPVARIVQAGAPDAYIAADGTVMPVSEKYTSRVLIVSGAFTKKLLDIGNLNKLEEGKQLLDMIGMINDDRFWKAQVAQLDVAGDGKITIYPQVTGQRIEFGKPEGFTAKFRKLMIFYKEILPQRGWTRYQRVNLEYEGQIIAE